MAYVCSVCTEIAQKRTRCVYATLHCFCLVLRLIAICSANSEQRTPSPTGNSNAKVQLIKCHFVCLLPADFSSCHG